MPSDSQPQYLNRPVRPDAVERYPASLAQRRLWFLNQLQPETSAYNVHVGLWLYGPLDLPFLESSLRDVIDRHETLRTTFALERGELMQLVSPTPLVELPVRDFSDLSEPYPSAYAFARQEVGAPFDLSKGPLFRACVLRIGPEENVLLCTMHHIITDASSMQVFTKELAILYQARKTRATPKLPELAIQYGDYSDWQNRWMDSEIAKEKQVYWKQTLANAPALLELPYDAPRPEEQTFEGTTLALEVPAEISGGIASLAKQRKATPFMVTLAAFKILLYRYSDQPDILVGVPVAGRSQVETEPLIGFFVDTVVLRDKLTGNPQFLDLIAQVRDTTVNALANADVPFEKVIETLRPQRSLSFNPVFQVMFSVIKSAIRTHTFGDLQAYPYIVYADSSILDLSAAFIEDSDGKWWLQFDYNTVLFKHERIVRMFHDYMEILRLIIHDPAIHIDELAFPGSMPSIAAKRASAGASASKVTIPTVAAESRGHAASQKADAHEELLIEIWKDVLDVEKISIHDNFFDIGGHSLLAARLTAQIQSATGRAIPVSAIFRAPTIATLSNILRDDVVPQPDSVVVRLREGSDRIPLFTVVAPGVDSFGVAMLARHMSGPDSLYKLQGTGPAVWGRPFKKDELRALARQYIDAMRTVQPSGPFCLAGMCDGVHLAQQMVLELESQGEEVALLAIFDTWVLENSQIRSLRALAYHMERLRNFPRLPFGEQFATMRRMLKRLAGRNRSQAKEWPQVYWPGERFQSPRFRAPVLLFKRPRQPYYYVRDPEMGWGDRSMGRVEICEVNCGHYEFLRLPYVRVIGQRLSQRLGEINKQAGASTSDATAAAARNDGLLLDELLATGRGANTNEQVGR